jgi:Flp pilus assembly CpaE family ATPase
MTVNLLFFNPTENLGSFHVRVSAGFSESAAAAATVVVAAEALNATVLGAKLGVGSINLTHPTAIAIKATTDINFNPIFIHQYFKLFD